MVSYGVTSTGFVRKDYTAISTDMNNRLRHLFGNDIDLTPANPIKSLADLCTVELVKLWIEAENTYNAGFIQTASNEDLDRLAALMGVTRLEGTPATGEILFGRNSVMASGSPQVINAGTIVKTSRSSPITYTTTDAVYFYPQITDEIYPAQGSSFTEFDAVNIVGEIVSITGDDLNDYTTNATFNGRTITTETTVPSGVELTLNYKPLSIVANIQSQIKSSVSNATANSITVMDTDIPFIHYVTNEAALTDGADMELDYDLRDRALDAAYAIGNATKDAIAYNIRNVTGVTNVIVKDVFIVDDSDVVVSDGSTTITVPNTPLYNVTSVTGETTGAHTVNAINIFTGEITLATAPNTSENVTIVYKWEDTTDINNGDTGKIKIFVSGGNVGDATTEDTIIYAIETTRAAGIQSIGYGTDGITSLVRGSNDSPYSWFYRIGEGIVDITITLIWDSESELDATSKSVVASQIETTITNFINSRELSDTLYKNKIIQLAISGHADIENATISVFDLNDAAQGDSMQGGAEELLSAGTITVV